MDLAKPYLTVDDVITGLSAIEAEWTTAGDRRVVFASVYRMMSEAMRRRIAQKAFEDNAWVARYTVAFANLYRLALRGFQAGRLQAVPRSWRIALETSRAGTALVLQDLLLGVNAHINHDLALALYEVGLARDRAMRRRDHETVNRVLSQITDQVQDRIAANYARGLSAADQIAGRLDEDLAGFGLRAARDSAWTLAVALTSARLELERRLIRKVLDRTSALVAQGILTMGGRGELAAKLRQFEQGEGFMKILEKG